MPGQKPGAAPHFAAKDVVAAKDVAHVRFSAPDLGRMETFLQDFGLVRAHRTEDVLYMRGLGERPFAHVTQRGEPGFLGLAFLFDDVAELEPLTRMEGASVIEDMKEPGGGKHVRFTDPDGFQVEAVAGQESPGPLPAPAPLPANDGYEKQRLGAPVRLEAAPAHVLRLGHCVLNVTDFRKSEAWYKQRFGLVTSDEIALDEETALGAFMRCGRGAQYVDHHTLFLLGTGNPGFNHAAFEVSGIDDLMSGNSHLQAKGYAHEWGVGRHILGSQIFDYWRDPWGHTVEHWTDGDLFNNETPPNRQGLETLLGVQWGPPPPPTLGS